MARTIRLTAAVVLLLLALVSAGLVQSLASPRWEALVSHGRDTPQQRINSFSQSDLYDAMRSDEKSLSLRPESLISTLCAACSGPDWSVTYQFVLPPGSALLAELRSATAAESALNAMSVGVGVLVAGEAPQPNPATIQQLAPDESAVVKVIAHWPQPPTIPAQVRLQTNPAQVHLRTEVNALETTERSFIVHTDDDFVLTALEGPQPETQDAHTLSFSDRENQLHKAEFVISSKDVTPFDTSATAPPKALLDAMQIVGNLWVSLIRLGPIMVLIGVLWLLRTKVALPEINRIVRFRLALVTSTFIVGAALVSITFGFPVNSLTAQLINWLQQISSEFPRVEWGYSASVEYALAIVLLGIGLPAVARTTERRFLRYEGAGKKALRKIVPLLTALIVSTIIVGLLSRSGDANSYYLDLGDRSALTLKQSGAWLVAVAITYCCVTLCVACAGWLALGSSGISAGIIIGAWFSTVTLVSPWINYAGLWPTVVRFGALAILTATSFYALCRLTVLWARGRPLSRTSGRTQVLVVLLCLTCALPIPAALPLTQSANVQWFDAWVVPMAVATALPLLAAAGIARLSCSTLAHHSAQRSAAILRLFTIALGALLLFSPTALASYVPLSYLTGLALLWWFALPSRCTNQDVLRGVSGEKRGQLMNRLIKVREVESSATRLRKVLDKEFDKGVLAWDKREARLITIRAVASGLRSGAPTGGLSLDAAALGTYPCDPLRWTKLGLLVGVIMGAPWMLLSIPGLLAFVELRGYAPLLAVLTAAVELLRWPAIGLVFAIGYPLLRGNSGMAKGATLFVTLALPSAVSLLLAEGDDGAWRSLLYLVSQLFIHCMILAVIAEVACLRSAGRPMTDLLVLHNLRAVVTWVSGLLAALAAAVSTALITGVTTLVLGILAPQASGVDSTSDAALESATPVSSVALQSKSDEAITALIKDSDAVAGSRFEFR